MWLDEIAATMKHQRFMESAQFTMPLRVMQSAQRCALAAIVVFAVLAGYALYLDHAWVATLFGVLDVATIIGLFLAPTFPRKGDHPGDEEE